MKRLLISILLLLAFVASLNASDSVEITKKDKTLIINLDNNSTNGSRGGMDLVTDIALEMIDIDVFRFVGKVLQKKLPIAIIITSGDNDEVEFEKKKLNKDNSFSIDKTKLKTKLKDGDYIRIKDKDGKLFFQGKVVTH